MFFSALSEIRIRLSLSSSARAFLPLPFISTLLVLFHRKKILELLKGQLPKSRISNLIFDMLPFNPIQNSQIANRNSGGGRFAMLGYDDLFAAVLRLVHNLTKSH